MICQRMNDPVNTAVESLSVDLFEYCCLARKLLFIGNVASVRYKWPNTLRKYVKFPDSQGLSSIEACCKTMVITSWGKQRQDARVKAVKKGPIYRKYIFHEIVTVSLGTSAPNVLQNSWVDSSILLCRFHLRLEEGFIGDLNKRHQNDFNEISKFP